MRLLTTLLAMLTLSILSGCAAYSVMNNDRYYDSRSKIPEENCPPGAAQQRSAEDDCKAL